MESFPRLFDLASGILYDATSLKASSDGPAGLPYGKEFHPSF